MVIFSKKLLNLTLVFSLSFAVFTPVSAANFGTFCRKSLGLVGGVVFVGGLLKMLQGRPVKGVSRMVSGVVVALGSICSDIIFNRVTSLAEGKGAVRQGAEAWYHGGVAAIGNAVQARQQLEDGKRACKRGDIVGGVDRIYDGIYHEIRGRCRCLLYSEVWQ